MKIPDFDDLCVNCGTDLRRLAALAKVAEKARALPETVRVKTTNSPGGMVFLADQPEEERAWLELLSALRALDGEE